MKEENKITEKDKQVINTEIKDVFIMDLRNVFFDFFQTIKEKNNYSDKR